MSDGDVIYRLRLACPLDDARLAHQIARIIGEAPSKVHKVMCDDPGAALFEFSIVSRDEFAQPGGVYAEEIKEVMSAFQAASVEPIIEEGIGGNWMKYGPDHLPNLIEAGEDTREQVRYLTDLEIGAIDQESVN